MRNIPEVRLGLIAVSRDCFPATLSEDRRTQLARAYRDRHDDLHECRIIVENESDALKALNDVRSHNVNALVVFLGNFGPETPETILAQRFDGPVMYIAAAEDDGNNLIDHRGDAFCGLLNCSYNLALRNIQAFIPSRPVGTAAELAERIAEFVPVARALIGVKNLKIISFGPRPQDFLACNAPIKPLFNLGIEIQENSELDLLVAFRKHAEDPRIPAIVADMKHELGDGNYLAPILPRLAQYELTLLDWIDGAIGSRQYVALANKCWPAFQTEFGFVPCYVNSRLAAQGIPVACEVDIYGALSEYIGTCVSGESVTLLDINNTVPRSIYESDIQGRFDYAPDDAFMAFHCGNTSAYRLVQPQMKHQIIMKRTLEPDTEPNITRGTIEGDIQPGDVTLYRLQATADGLLRAYAAQGEVLPVATRSFGSIGVFAIREMGRFYRHVLIARSFPHHAAIAFGKFGKPLHDVFRYLGVRDIGYNQPKGLPYPDENPFE